MLRTRILLPLLLAFLLAMLLVALNPERIPLNLVLFKPTPRVGVALALTLAVGLLLGVLVRAGWLASLLRERGRLRRALKSAEQRVLTKQATTSSPPAA